MTKSIFGPIAFLPLLAVAVRAQFAVPVQNASFDLGPADGIVAWSSAPGWNGTTVLTYADPSPGPGAWIINFGGAGVDSWAAPYDKVLSTGWGGAPSQVYQYTGFQVPAGMSITVSAEVLNGSGAGSGNFRLGFTGNPQDQNGSNIFFNGPQFSATTNWQRFSYTVNSAEHPGIVGKYVMPWLSTDDGNWTNHQRWDNVRVTAGYRSSRPLATWAWDWTWAPVRPEGFENYARGLLDFCAQKNIGTIYLSLDFPVPEEQRAITAQFLERARAQGVRVEASAFARSRNGVPYSHPGGEQGFYDYLDGVLAWNREHPAGQRFDGAHFDVEEYTATWIDALRTVWQGPTLAQLKAIDPAFQLGAVAVPAHWWDTDYGFRLQDHTDYISVMSYFQGDTTLGFFTGRSKVALDYAGQRGKKINIGLETSIWRGEGENYPGWEYMSFAAPGEGELSHRMGKINAEFAGHPGFGAVVIQSSDSYQRLSAATVEIGRDRILYGRADAAAEALPPGMAVAQTAGFASRAHYSAENPSVTTRMATVDLVPALAPGELLVLDAEFSAYGETRWNALTDQTVPKELLWFGFTDVAPAYRFLRIDHNGSLGLRTIGNRLEGAPGDWKNILRLSHDRFTPQPGKSYQFRLYFLGDQRVLLKIVDPSTGRVAWHSDRMPHDRGNLGRMYLEIADEAGADGEVSFDAAGGSFRLRRGGTDFAKIGNLRRGFIPAAFTSWAGGAPPTPANLNLYAVGGAGSPEDGGGLPAVTVLPPQVSRLNLPLTNASFESGDRSGWTDWRTSGYTEYFTIPGAAAQGQHGSHVTRLGHVSPLQQWVSPMVRVEPDTTYTLDALAGVPPGQNWIGRGLTSRGTLDLGAAPAHGDETGIRWFSTAFSSTNETMERQAVSFDSADHPELVGRFLLARLQVAAGWENYVDWDDIRLGSETSRGLSLAATVRANDPGLSVAGEASEDLVNWSTNGVTMTIPADQSGVPAGCRRQIFTAEPGTTGKKFLRLRSVLTGL